jgi:hypothetical protein
MPTGELARANRSRRRRSSSGAISPRPFWPRARSSRRWVPRSESGSAVRQGRQAARQHRRSSHARPGDRRNRKRRPRSHARPTRGRIAAGRGESWPPYTDCFPWKSNARNWISPAGRQPVRSANWKSPAKRTFAGRTLRPRPRWSKPRNGWPSRRPACHRRNGSRTGLASLRRGSQASRRRSRPSAIGRGQRQSPAFLRHDHGAHRRRDRLGFHPGRRNGRRRLQRPDVRHDHRPRPLQVDAYVDEVDIGKVRPDKRPCSPSTRFPAASSEAGSAPSIPRRSSRTTW